MKIAHIGTTVSLNHVVLNQMAHQIAVGHQVTALCPDDEWVFDLRAAGIRVVPVSFLRHDVLATIRAGLMVWKICRAERFDVLHTHNTLPGIIGRVAGRVAGIKAVVHTCHAWPLHQTRGWALRSVVVRMAETLAARASQAVLFQNQDDMDACLRLKVVPPGKAILIGNGVDVEKITGAVSPNARRNIRRELGIEEDTFVFVTIARLEPPKGHTFLLDGLRNLVDDGRKNFVALFVGIGSERHDLETQVSRLGLSQIVRFTGYRSDIPDLIVAADAGVLTSRFEGVPRGLMEPMVLGLPVVGTDVPGTRGLINHRVTGLLVSYGDVPGLAAALYEVMADSGLAARIGQNGKRLVEDQFDERHLVDRIEEVYNQILGGSGEATAANCG